MRFILLLILLCLNFSAFSEIFVVTSNADSGPGSLREALQKAAANGVGQKDYIHFNLPGSTDAQRTIILSAELPRVTSNLIIDATTQPGRFLGVSSSKIIIKPDRSTYQASLLSTAAFFIAEAHDVEIYGFYFTGFFYIRDQYGNFSNAQSCGVFIISCNNIIIGAPHKGNIFTYNDYGLFVSAVNDNSYSMQLSTNIKVRSNWIGLEEMGNFYSPPWFNPTGMLISGGVGTEVGGSTEEEGNIFGGYFYLGLGLGGEGIVASNNKFGIDINGKTEGVVRIEGSGEGLIFKDNVASSFYIQLSYLKNFKVTGNKDLVNIGVLSSDLELYFCENGQIGTDDDADKNIFRLSLTAISSFGGKNIEIRKNSIICTKGAYAAVHDEMPEIEVLVNNDAEYSGKTNPNADIYIYNDNTNCEICNPVEFYKKIRADAMGNWKIIGDFSRNRFVANSTLIKSSSEYTQPAILPNSSEYPNSIINPTCGLKNGSIKLLSIKHVLKIEWFDDKNLKIGEGAEIKELGPGKYRAKLSNGKCFVNYDNISLINSEPFFDDQNLQITNPGCGIKNGSIEGLIAGSTDGKELELRWFDKNNIEVGTESTISDLGPGEYRLIAKDKENCTKTYGPVILTNQSGPSIDLSSVIFKNATCDGSNGSITNVKVTGTGNITYTWKNAAGVTVGNTRDLINVQSGWYALEVKDGTACPVLGSAPVQVKEINGIIIDEAKAVVVPIACSASTGGVRGILVSGAITYKWVDEGNHEVGHSLDLTGVGIGKYRLLASNNSGCTKQSKMYEIKELATTPFDVYAIGGSSSYCHEPNGSIIVEVKGIQPLKFKWVNSSGVTVGNSSILTATDGKYKLYLTDNNNCESFYREFSILNVAEAVINRGEEKVTNDQCNLGKGSIKAPGISGTPPYYYYWSDSNGQSIGSGSVLENISAGNYSLMIGDALTCSRQTILYTVLNEDKILSPPILNDLKICAAGDAFIQVMQPGIGTYVLYNENGIRLDQSASGTFKVNIINSQNYLVKQIVGLCESPAAKIRVTIENEGLSKLSNAISPNNDGLNDFWQIPDMINYPEGTVLIFNRYGQKVFASTGYKQPFDGRQNGKDLPVGTYYYIIDLKRACGLLKGSITIIR